MSEEVKGLTVVEGQTVDQQGLSLDRRPQQSLEDAAKAAQALRQALHNNPDRKVLRLQGKEYLYAEDWATVASFYGVTPSIESVDPVELGGVTGFRAVATAISVKHDGLVISRAIAFCMSDEENWKNKPLFQLASMAQTRAQAKVLRGPFARVVSLAGFAPTPADEMTGNEGGGKAPSPFAGTPVSDEAISHGAVLEGVTIEDFSRKEGGSGAKRWTKYGVKVSGFWYSTFDQKMGFMAQAIFEAGTPCTIKWEQEGKFKNLIDIVDDTRPPEPAEEGDPELPY